MAAITLTIAAGCGGTSSAAQPTAPAVAPGGANAVPSAIASAAPTTSTGAGSTPEATPATAPRPSAVPIVSRDPEQPLQHLWTATATDSSNSSLWSPAIDREGNIWAASYADNTFKIASRDGKQLDSWGGGGAGDGDGQFRLAAEGLGYGAIAFRPDGGFYVADAGNARIDQFDAKRKFVRSFATFGDGPGELALPIDIDLDGAGNVYVFDDHRRDIQVFDPDGAFIRVAATNVGPYGGVTDDGRVYAVDNDTVTLYRFLPDGTRDLAVDLRPMVHFSTGLAVSPDGSLFMGTTDMGGAKPTYTGLLHLSPDGSLLDVWPEGAEGLVVDPAGDRIYVTTPDGDPGIHAYALPKS